MTDSPRKAYLVTGAARRVGAAIVRRLHADGGNVLIHYRGAPDDADALAAELNAHRPHSAAAHGLDLSDTDGLEALVGAALQAYGRLDGLINNASGFFPTPLGTITTAQWDDLMASNLKAPLFLAQAAAPELKKTRGAIVNIIDIHAERPLKQYVVYSAAKAGLAGLTRSLALELAPEVRVNGVSPGAIKWPDDSTNSGQFGPAERARILAATPLGREGGEDEIAKAVAFLLDGPSYITGQILAVDGGRSIYL
jgi:pteridine reductase